MLRAPEMDAGLQVGSHHSRVEEQNHLPYSAGIDEDIKQFWSQYGPLRDTTRH